MENGLDLKVNRLPVQDLEPAEDERGPVGTDRGGEGPCRDHGRIFRTGSVGGGYSQSIADRDGPEDMDRLGAAAEAAPIRIGAEAAAIRGAAEVFSTRTAAGEECRAALHFACQDGENRFQPVEILAGEGERLTVVMDFTSAPGERRTDRRADPV